MITQCPECGGLRAEPGEMYAGKPCECPTQPSNDWKRGMRDAADIARKEFEDPNWDAGYHNAAYFIYLAITKAIDARKDK